MDAGDRGERHRTPRARSSAPIPAAGIVVATGDTITVYVSTGKKTVAVPDVHNMTADAAKQALTAAGLTVGHA